MEQRDGEPAEYAEAQCGHANATKETYKYAIAYFDIFGFTKHYERFEEMLAAKNEDILCNESMWRQFATWLHSHGRQISDQKKHIEAGSALNYLSALTTLCSKQFTNHRLWEKRSFNTWYTEIRKDVENTINRRAMEEGDDNGDEVQDIDRKLLMRLNVSWNELGTQDDLIKAGAATMSFFCTGRGGEYRYCSGKSRTHTFG